MPTHLVALDAFRNRGQRLLTMVVSCLRWSLILLALGAGSVRAGPMDYALPPPPLHVPDLGLPAVATNDAATGVADITSMRGMRDEALRSFYRNDFTNCLHWLDRMAKTAPPAPNLRQLQAWAATYAGQEQRAFALWSTLANAQPDQAALQEMAGWHAFRLNLHSNAAVRYAAALRLQPAQSRLVVMSALVAWSEARTPAAQRQLVQAMRMSPPPIESFAAMAGLLASSGSYPEAAGWLRRGLRGLDPAVQARWLNSPDFRILATAWPEGWRDLLNELNQLALLEATPPAPRPSVQPAAVTAGPSESSADERMLRLGLFSPEPSVRFQQIRLYQSEQILQRLRANEVLTEDQRVGEFEMRLDAR